MDFSFLVLAAAIWKIRVLALFFRLERLLSTPEFSVNLFLDDIPFFILVLVNKYVGIASQHY